MKYLFLISFIFIQWFHKRGLALDFETVTSVDTPFHESFCNLGEPEKIDVKKIGNGKINFQTVAESKNWLIVVNKNEDDGIQITMESFRLESFFLIIKEKFQTTHTDVQIVTGSLTPNVDEPLKFKIPYAKSFYIELCKDPTKSAAEEHFLLQYERIETKFGPDPLPEEPEEVQRQKESYEIQFKGKSTDAYLNNEYIRKFKIVLRFIAMDYCYTHNIKFENYKSPEEMISIHAIHKCPSEWLDADLCASIRHSIFVSGNNDKKPKYIWEYELNAENLEDMWKNYNGTDLEELGISIYKLSENVETMGLWFLTIIFPLFLFFLIIIGMKTICTYLLEDPRKNNEKSNNTVTKRRKKTKLRLNEFQKLPPFMQNQSTIYSTNQNLEATDGTELTQQSYYSTVLFPRSHQMDH